MKLFALFLAVLLASAPFSLAQADETCGQAFLRLISDGQKAGTAVADVNVNRRELEALQKVAKLSDVEDSKFNYQIEEIKREAKKPLYDFAQSCFFAEHFAEQKISADGKETACERDLDLIIEQAMEQGFETATLADFINPTQDAHPANEYLRQMRDTSPNLIRSRALDEKLRLREHFLQGCVDGEKSFSG